MTEILDLLCKAKGTNYSKLEKALGMGNGTIKKSFPIMRSDRLKAIADYFGVTMEYLMTGDGQPKKQKSYYQISNFEYQIILKLREIEPSVRKYILGSLGLEEPDGERVQKESEDFAV